MRRVTLLTLAVALIVALSAGVAAAKLVTGTAQGELLRGTDQADTILGRGGNDDLRGRGGADTLKGGPDRDEVYGMDGSDKKILGGVQEDKLNGGLGNDFIDAADDRDSDSVTCGEGESDVARVSLVDEVDGQDVGSTPEGVLESVTTCEDIRIVILDNDLEGV